MGSYVTRILPLVLGLSFFLKLNKIQEYCYLILLISFILVLLSGERLALIYWIMVFFFYIFLNFKKKYFFYFFFAVITVISIFYLFDIKSLKRFTTHTYSQYKETNSLIYLSFRHYTHYLTAYRMFLDNKILGHGVKSFRYLCSDEKYSTLNEIINVNGIKSPSNGYFSINLNDKYYAIKSLDGRVKTYRAGKKYFTFYVTPGSYVSKDQLLFSNYEFNNGCSTHPHNFYMQFLAELGLIGFALFISIFIFTLYKLTRCCYLNFKKNISNHEKGLSLILLGVFMVMMPILPSGNFFNNWMMAINFLPIGFYLSLISKK